MNILILGGGGREHALAWAVKQNPKCDRLIVAPGNAGIAAIAECADIDVLDGTTVVTFAEENAIDFVIVGPEAPLAAGVADALRGAGILTFGPSAAAARLEASKAFTKEICDAAGAPTAGYARFDEKAAAVDHVLRTGAPIVVKADGLAAGKGVVVAMTVEEALAALDDMFGGSLGAAGAEVVIEEFMEGEEASFFVLCDGRDVLAVGTAQDHKRVGDGDTGPNTGGMGAYSPAPVLSDDIAQRALDEIVRPTVAEMARRGTPFQGVLYAGLMIKGGAPRLVEYNVRFGDPECQVLMIRMMSDIVPALLASVDGQLKHFDLRWYDEPALTVIMATKGYPGDYGKGSRIEGLEDAAQVVGVEIFHAGTKRVDGHIVANGGRVLNICASGKTVKEAQARAYEAVDRIRWPEGFCRRDIGWRAVEREHS